MTHPLPEVENQATSLPQPAGEDGRTVTRIPLQELSPSPTNPRKHFVQEEIEELAHNILTQGLMQPIIARPLRAMVVTATDGATTELPPASREKCQALLQQLGISQEDITECEIDDDCGYEIVAGERRYRAHCFLRDNVDPESWAAIDCLVRDLTDRQVLEMQISENLQREDLTPLDWANAYAAMVEAERVQEGSERGAVMRVAGRLGKSPSVIYQTMQLAKLCDEAQTALRKGWITKNHAIDCARLTNKQQIEYLGECLFDEDWSFSQPDASERIAGDEEPEQVKSVRSMRQWIEDAFGEADDNARGTSQSPAPAIDDDTIAEAAQMRTEGLANGCGSNQDICDFPAATPARKPTHSNVDYRKIPGPSVDVNKAEEEAAKQRENQAVMQAAVKRIMTATHAASKKSGQLLTADDARVALTEIFYGLPSSARTAVAELLRWENFENDHYGISYRKIRDMEPEMLSEFMVLCALSGQLVHPEGVSTALTSLGAKYKVYVHEIRAELRGERKPAPVVKPAKAKPAAKPKPAAKTRSAAKGSVKSKAAAKLPQKPKAKLKPKPKVRVQQKPLKAKKAKGKAA